MNPIQLKEARIKANISTKEVAARCACDPHIIVGYETFKRQPPPYYAQLLELMIKEKYLRLCSVVLLKQIKHDKRGAVRMPMLNHIAEFDTYNELMELFTKAGVQRVYDACEKRTDLEGRPLV